MHWYQKRAIKDLQTSTSNKLKGLGLALIKEPINLVIIVGLLLLSFGFNLESLPSFVQNTALHIKVIMTPLILLFIGMAVRIKSGEFGLILSLLTRRAGITFCLSAVFILLFPALSAPLVLLLIVFPQSSCSFWPFAHMSAISSMEENDKQDKPTFDINFAVNVLALSLPFSTMLAIGIFSFSDFFINPTILLLIGFGMVTVSFIPYIIEKVKKNKEAELSGQFNTYVGIDSQTSEES
ncbi:hypothetical protein [Zobellia laminariae]|uniref:hypothetical protein n=1 Tax=Zobellia laminariae TaxID=248906 RepID=UPI0026F430D6|nr:hypothetical protein [Zobellia laminariae]WKX74939.1 hypothetical protein Q5W13_14330 [Zobellia laminariae]